MDAGVGQLSGQNRDLAGGGAYDQADVGLGGIDTLQRMHPQEEPGEGGHLVCAHQPGADRDEQHELGREGHQAQTPKRNRAYATGSVEHQLDGAWIGLGLAEIGRARRWDRVTRLGQCIQAVDAVSAVGKLGGGYGVLARDGYEPFARMLGTAAQSVVFGEGGLYLGAQLAGVVGQA